MSETENKKNSNGVFMIIIFLLLGGLAVMSYMWSTKRTELNNCSNENLTLKSDMQGMNDMMQGYVGNISNDIKKDFKNMLATYDKLIAKDATQADSLNKQKEKIMTLMNELDAAKRSGRLTASKLFQLNKENETLRDIMKSYVKQIDSLNTMNIKLTSELDVTTTKLTTTAVERDNYKKTQKKKQTSLKREASFLLML